MGKNITSCARNDLKIRKPKINTPNVNRAKRISHYPKRNHEPLEDISSASVQQTYLMHNSELNSH